MFLHRFVDQYGLPQPAAPRDQGKSPPVYLPASQSKKAIHKLYQESCTAKDTNPVDLSSFKDILLKCLPHEQLMTPRTDCCLKCERFRSQELEVTTEKEKLAVTSAFVAQVHGAQKE